MGSATVSVVSPFIISIVVAGAVAALGQVEGGAIGAEDWRPLSTIERVIPLLVAFLPLETVAAGAVAGMAPFSIVKPEIGVATEAIFFVIRAHIPAPPIISPYLACLASLAAVHGLVVVREE